ncbi:MAG: thermonuclease family protein [Alphaproteobacteria bacterium]
MKGNCLSIGAVIIVLNAFILVSVRADDLAGAAHSIDGDTIVVLGEQIRLFGIDAPEVQQLCQRQGSYWPCGVAAAHALAQKVVGRDVICRPRAHDRHWRVFGICYVDGEDLNAWVVREGWALAYRRHSMDYVEAEEEAKAARRGLWSSEFQMPWEYRRKKPAAGAPETGKLE